MGWWGEGESTDGRLEMCSIHVYYEFCWGNEKMRKRRKRRRGLILI